MTFLSSLLDDKRKTQSPLVLLQSSAAQSAIPILRGIIDAQQKNSLILVCTLHDPTDLLGLKSTSRESTTILDWTSEVPGYCNEPIDWQARLEVIKKTVKGMFACQSA